MAKPKKASKNNHGGARPNSGPKNPARLGRTATSVSLSAAEREHATIEAAKLQLTIQGVVRLWGQGRITFVWTGSQWVSRL